MKTVKIMTSSQGTRPESVVTAPNIPIVKEIKLPEDNFGGLY
jgi:hypothetical protein